MQAGYFDAPFEDGDHGLTAHELREMTDPANGAGWEVLGHGYTAMKLARTTLAASASAGATSMTVDEGKVLGLINGSPPEDGGYTYRLIDGSTTEIVRDVGGDTSTGDATLESSLNNSYGTGTEVWPTDETLSREIGGAKNELQDHGFTANGWVFSGHNTLGATGRAVVSRYYQWSRTQQYGDDDVTQAPEDTPLERFALDSVKYDVLSSTQRSNFLDEIESNNKLGIAFAHADSASVSDADTFLSEVADREIDVVTPSEAIARFEDNTPSQPQGRPVPENGLRGWYPMLNEQSTVLDASGFGNDATWNTTAEYTTGPFGRAAKFAVGSSDNLQVTNDSSIIPGSGDYSIVATVKTFDLQLGNRNYFWFFGGTGGQLDCYWNNGSVTASIDDGSDSASVSEQYIPSGSGDVLQIAFVRDTTAGEFDLYLNAAQDSNNNLASDPTGDVSPSNDLKFGNDGGYELYDYRVYNRIVERHELQNLLNNVVPPSVREGDYRSFTPGRGFVTTTPDGSSEYRIRVDDSGNVVTDQL